MKHFVKLLSIKDDAILKKGSRKRTLLSKVEIYCNKLQGFSVLERWQEKVLIQSKYKNVEFHSIVMTDIVKFAPHGAASIQDIQTEFYKYEYVKLVYLYKQKIPDDNIGKKLSQGGMLTERLYSVDDIFININELPIAFRNEIELAKKLQKFTY